MYPWMKTLVAACALPALLCLQPAAALGASVSVIETSFDSDTWIKPTEKIRIKFDRLPDASEGKLAILVNQSDLTSQFKTVGNELVYDPSVVKLPSGEKELVVHLVRGPDEWEEIARYSLRVLTKFGLEHLDFTPRADASVAQGLDARDQGEIAPPGKIPFTEGTFDVGLAAEASKEDVEIQGEVNFLGVTNREQALQFSEEGSKAEQSKRPAIKSGRRSASGLRVVAFMRLAYRIGG